MLCCACPFIGKKAISSEKIELEKETGTKERVH